MARLHTLAALMGLVLFGFLNMTHAATQSAVCVIDDAAQKVCVHHPGRVVSLVPHATEMLAFLGARNQLVGVDTASTYPDWAQALPKLGDYLRIDLEKLVALKPDLVIVWKSGITPDQLQTMRALGLNVFVSEPLTVSAVASNMQRLATLLGLGESADLKIKDWLSQFDALRLAHENLPPVRVFYQVWNDPLMTLSGQHVVSQIIHWCGGRNVFASLNQLSPTVSLESVLKAKPQLILASGDSRTLSQLQTQWSVWKNLPAVKHKQIAVIPQDILVRNGPRLLQAAQLVCQRINAARIALPALNGDAK